MTPHKYAPICDVGAKGLGFGIVRGAVEDWYRSVRFVKKYGRPPSPELSFENLRAFFRSGWCEMLLQDTRLTGEIKTARIQIVDHKITKFQASYGGNIGSHGATKGGEIGQPLFQ